MRDSEHSSGQIKARRHGLPPYPGIVEALDALSGVPLGVFTNADQGNIRVLLGTAGIAHRFAYFWRVRGFPPRGL